MTIMPLWYRPKQLSPSYTRNMRLGRLLTKNPDVLPLLEALNMDREGGQELEISHLDREALYAF